MRSCERRSFDAATIFIALVICCVFFTARIRRRRSISEGICPRLAAEAVSGCRRLPRREVLRELLHRAVERGLQLIVQLLLLADPLNTCGCRDSMYAYNSVSKLRTSDTAMLSR